MSDKLTYSNKSQFSDHLLKAIRPVIASEQFRGKVDDSAINKILKSIELLQKNQVEFQRELTSKSNDALVNEIQKALSKLYSKTAETVESSGTESQATVESANSIDIDALSTRLAEKLSASSKEDTATETDAEKGIQDLDDKLSEIKDALSESNESDSEASPIADEIGGDVGDDVGNEKNFQSLQDYINSQLTVVKQVNEQLLTDKLDVKNFDNIFTDPFKQIKENLTTAIKDIVQNKIVDALKGPTDKLQSSLSADKPIGKVAEVGVDKPAASKVGGATTKGADSLGGKGKGPFGSILKALKPLQPLFKMISPIIKPLMKAFPIINIIQYIMQILDPLFDMVEWIIGFLIKYIQMCIYIIVGLIFVALMVLILIPILLIVTSIVVLTVLIILFIYWIKQKIKDIIDNLLYYWDVVCDWWHNFWIDVSNYWNDLTIVKWFKDWMKEIDEAGGFFSYLGKCISDAWDGIKSFFSEKWDAFVGWFNDLWIVKYLKEKWEALQKWWDSFSFADLGKGLLDWVKRKISETAIPFPNGVSCTWKEIDISWLPTFSIPIPNVSWDVWKPFADLAPKAEIDVPEPPKVATDEVKPVELPVAVNKEEISQIAEQVAKGQGEPLATLKAAQDMDNKELNATVQQIDAENEKKAQEEKQYKDLQLLQSENMQGYLKEMNENINKKLDKPHVVPVPLPYEKQQMKW